MKHLITQLILFIIYSAVIHQLFLSHTIIQSTWSATVLYLIGFIVACSVITFFYGIIASIFYLGINNSH